jgi:ELWxxDGT repeat protein
MSLRSSREMLSRAVARWLDLKGLRRGRPRPVRLRIEELERRQMLSGSPFLVNDVNPGPLSSTGFSGSGSERGAIDADYTNVSGETFFRANDGSHGFELWKTNGTSAGTTLVKDINPGSANSMGSLLIGGHLTNVSGTLFFQANDGSHGYELWKSNGTAAGTVMVKDINPGPGNGPGYLPYLTNVNGTLFFTANDGSHGYQLWKSDGTAGGTTLVSDIKPGSAGAFLTEFTNVNGTLFFRANDGSHGDELWKSDGSSAGTQMVSDINPGFSGSFPADLTNVNGTLFFDSLEGSTESLWKSDGTSAGTQVVTTPGGMPLNLTNANGVLFFTTHPGSTGSSLWKSDGTSAGTTLVVAGLDPNTGLNLPGGLTPVGGTLFFSATDGSHGYQLWKSDGTSAGTQMVKDINPSGSSNPSLLTNGNGVLFFSANDGTHGYELWTSDGTSAGTTLVQDIYPGSPSSLNKSVADFTNVSGTLFFTANDGSHGYEPWAEPGPAVPGPTLTGLSPGTAAEGSTTFTLTLSGSNFDSTAAVLWDGTSLATQFNSSSQLQAQVPASLVADEGTATVSVTEDSGTSNGLAFTISDAPLTLTAVNAPAGATEGTSTGTFTVATFTDGNTGAPLTDFTAVVHWGDGTTSTITIANGLSGSAGSFAVQASHTFASAGTLTLSVQVLDEGGSSVSNNSSPFTVAASPLSITAVNAVTGLTEGQNTGTFTVATFTDSNTGEPVTNFTAVIGWGDGTTSTILKSPANGTTAGIDIASLVVDQTLLPSGMGPALGISDAALSQQIAYLQSSLNSL